MKAIYAVHILAGTLGLLSGYVALATTKGGSTHRRVGMLFVYSMLTMAVFGATITAARGIAPAVNYPAAIITTMLIITSLVTVRPELGSRLSALGLTLLSFGVGIPMLIWGFEAAASGTKFGMPAFPFFLFGAIGTLAGIGDLRLLRTGPLTGAPRLARHLWRMCFALFFAALSASVQFAKMAPKLLKVPIMTIPMLVVLGAVIYWMWRVRVRRSLRGLVVGSPQVAGARA
jgi:uncharacterized membrane protein